MTYTCDKCKKKVNTIRLDKKVKGNYWLCDDCFFSVDKPRDTKRTKRYN